MFIIGNLFIALARVCDMILGLATWLIIFRALISWVNPDPYNPIVQFLHRATEPMLAPFRRLLPLGRVDFSPILAFVCIVFLQSFLVASISDLGYRLRMSGSSSTIQYQTIEPQTQKSKTSSELFR